MSPSWKPLFVLVLLGLVCTEATKPWKSQLKKRSGKPANRNGTLEYTAANRTLNFLPTARDVYSLKLRNYHDTYYKGAVSVGSPPQNFEVVFDTGCTLNWFPKVNCASSGPHSEACKDPKRTYSPRNSTTSRAVQAFSLYRYYTKSYVSGMVYRDTLRLGSPKSGKQLELKNAMVGAADWVKMFDHGVIGLARADNNFIKPYFTDAYNRDKLYGKPLFTVHFKRCGGECEDGGQITFGGLDEANCQSNIHWIPADKDTYMWQFPIQSMNTPVPRTRAIKGVVDTGNSYIHLPTDMFAAYSKLWNAREEMGGKFHSVACDAKLQLSITINGKLFELSEKELLLNQEFDAGHCVLAVSPQKDVKDLVVLGAPFFRAYCVSHDTDKQQVGFAPVKKQL